MMQFGGIRWFIGRTAANEQAKTTDGEEPTHELDNLLPGLLIPIECDVFDCVVVGYVPRALGQSFLGDNVS